MKSKILHICERLLFYLIGLNIGLFLLVKAQIINFHLFLVLSCLTFLSLIGTQLYFRKWKRKGFELSKQLCLKSIVIFPTNLKNEHQEIIYELHHKPTSVLYGFKLRKVQRELIKDQLNRNLTEDFAHLYRFTKKNRVALISFTHERMFQIWRKASESLFLVRPINLHDRWAKPLWIQWVVLSFSTTGRITPVPKNWIGIGFKCMETKRKEFLN